MEPVHEAAERNNVEELRKLLDAEPDLVHASSDEELDTPLHLACREGHVEAVRLLLDRGADMDALNDDQRTPLWWACARGQVEVVRLLLAQGADPTSRCLLGFTALMMASAPYCSSHGTAALVVRLLLEDGRSRVNARDNKGCTALWLACQCNQAEAARILLLEAGADHTVTDILNNNALDAARSRRSQDCVRLLEWYEGELEGAYVLSKARAVADLDENIIKAAEKAGAKTEAEAQQAMEEAAPAYVRGRVESGEALPVLEVVVEARGGKRESEGEEEGEEEECGAVCEHVVRWLKGDLFVELMEGVWFRKSREPVDEDSVFVKLFRRAIEEG